MVGLTVSTENTTHPKSMKSRNSDSPVTRSTNSNRDFDFIPIRTEEFEFLDLVDFGGVAFSVESDMDVLKSLLYSCFVYYIELLLQCVLICEPLCENKSANVYMYIYIYMYLCIYVSISQLWPPK